MTIRPPGRFELIPIGTTRSSVILCVRNETNILDLEERKLIEVHVTVLNVYNLMIVINPLAAVGDISSPPARVLEADFSAREFD